MSDSFDKLISEYKDYSDLLEYSRSQFRVINDMSRKLQKLEEDNKELKKLADKATPIDIGSSEVSGSAFGSSDPEIIARTQLALLKRTSLEGEELTLEESKKAQIFTDILLKSQIKDESKKVPLDTKTLLDFLESPDGSRA